MTLTNGPEPYFEFKQVSSDGEVLSLRVPSNTDYIALTEAFERFVKGCGYYPYGTLLWADTELSDLQDDDELSELELDEAFNDKPKSSVRKSKKRTRA
jgi:hypothetical protein